MLQLFGEVAQPRPGMRPVVERGLQRAGDARRLGGSGEIARDDNQPPVARAVLEGGEFHGGLCEQRIDRPSRPLRSMDWAT